MRRVPTRVTVDHHEVSRRPDGEVSTVGARLDDADVIVVGAGPAGSAAQ